MKTRILHTKFYQDTYILSLSPKEKFLFLYLLTNERVEKTGAYELPISVIQFETGLGETEILKTLEKFQAVEKIFYIENFIVIKKIRKYQDYSKGSPKQRESYEKELNDLPEKVRELILTSYQLVPNQLPTSSQLVINNKEERINNKYKIINNKKEKEEEKEKVEYEVLQEKNYTLEDFIEDYNQIRSFYLPNARGLKVIDSQTKKHFKDLQDAGVTREDMQQALKSMFSDKHHKETNWRYCTPEFITRSDKFARFSMTEDFQSIDKKKLNIDFI